MIRALISLTIGASLLAAALNTAVAQPRDRCHDYATFMVTTDQRARQARCTSWNGSSDYNGHYRWCQRQSPQTVQATRSQMQSIFQQCQFAASGSPAARAENARCRAYANDMLRMDRTGAQGRCPGWTGRTTHAMHFNWCLSVPPQRASEALAHGRGRLMSCGLR